MASLYTNTYYTNILTHFCTYKSWNDQFSNCMKNYLGFAFVLQTSYMGRKMVIICCTKYWETRYTLKHFATTGKRSQKLNLLNNFFPFKHWNSLAKKWKILTLACVLFKHNETRQSFCFQSQSKHAHSKSSLPNSVMLFYAISFFCYWFIFGWNLSRLRTRIYYGRVHKSYFIVLVANESKVTPTGILLGTRQCV